MCTIIGLMTLIHGHNRPAEEFPCLAEPLQDDIPDDALDELPAVHVVQLHAVGDLVGQSVVLEPPKRVRVEVVGIHPQSLLLPIFQGSL